jgi:hypothetical protein
MIKHLPKTQVLVSLWVSGFKKKYMKKIILLLTGFIFSLTLVAQGNKSGKGKVKDKTKNEKAINHKNSDHVSKGKDEHSKKVWGGTRGNKNLGTNSSKNQPAKVRSAFQRDYPNATNVSWSKYRGDWAATFGNGLVTSTAVYHANGERRDTRTPVTKNEVPGSIWDSIFKRRPGTSSADIIKIEAPHTGKIIFRFKDIIQGKPDYFYYNHDGQVVTYNY